LAIALVVLLVAIPVFVTTEAPLVLLVAVFLWGAGSGASWVISSTLLQRLAGDARIGRLTALDELVNVLSMQLSALLVAVAVTAGLTPLAAAAAPLGLAAVVGVVNLRALSRASRPAVPIAEAAAG
jgi:hypothetical protein